MTSSLSHEIVPMLLARRGSELKIHWDTSELPRVRDVILPNKDAEFTLDLKFDVTPDGVSFATGAMVGEVVMSCQRCLEPMSLPLRIAIKWEFVPHESAVLSLGCGFEPVVAGANESLALAELLSDEILLSLPYAPCHEHDCVPAAAQDDDEAGKPASPFASLSLLRR